MTLEALKDVKPSRATNGRPSSTLTDKEWQTEFSIMKLYIKAGKNKKLRAGDIVGAILSNENVDMKDIGVIEVLEYQSYVEILNGKGNLVLNHLNNRKIKNKSIVVEKAR